MSRRKRRSPSGKFIIAFMILLCLVIGLTIIRDVSSLALLAAIPAAYIIGRAHEHSSHIRQYRSGRQYRLRKNDPVNTTIRILPHTDPPEPTDPPKTTDPRPYYGGQWNPADGYRPIDKVSRYPEEYRPRTSRDDILNDPRSGAHDLGDQ
jgi:hypothetical protein